MTPDRIAVIPLLARSKAVVGYTLVDEADALWVRQWTWRRLPNGYVNRGEGAGRGTVYLHRELLGLVKGDGREGDHINRDRADNRRCNLRVATPGLNRQNTTPFVGGSSRLRGVSWDTSRGQWLAQAQLDGKRIWLGRYESEEEAGEVVAAWRREHMPFSEEAAS